jgi:hypothetical protein
MCALLVYACGEPHDPLAPQAQRSIDSVAIDAGVYASPAFSGDVRLPCLDEQLHALHDLAIDYVVTDSPNGPQLHFHARSPLATTLRGRSSTWVMTRYAGPFASPRGSLTHVTETAHFADGEGAAMIVRASMLVAWDAAEGLRVTENSHKCSLR